MANIIPLQINPNPPAGALPPQIPTLSFSEFVSNLVALWAANTGADPSLSAGDPLLAIFQSMSSQFIFLESVATQLAALTRAQTSTGANLDTWMAQFSFTRLPAVAPVGSITLTALSAHSTNTTVPLTTIVQTAGGSIQYQLVADTTQAAYSSALNAYVLPAGQTSITATAQSIQPGTAYNVQANQLTQFAASVPGIDLVTNPDPILNGVNAESDSAFRARFVLYFESLREATIPAVEAAIESVQAGIQYVVVPNEQLDGTPQYGYFYATIWPYTDALQASVYTAVAAVVALGIQFNIYSATEVQVSVTVNITVAAGYVVADVQTAVQNAVLDFIGSLELGQNLYWSQLYAVVYAVAGVQDASALLIDGSNADIIATPQHIIQPSTVTVTVVS